MKKQHRKVGIDRLAELPMDYLFHGEGWVEEQWLDDCASEAYRAVFTAGLWAWQLHTYHSLVNSRYGRHVAFEVRGYQRRFLDQETGTAALVERALDLISGAVNSGTVRAPVGLGDIAIPVEMNAAMALLLGMPESPDYVEHAQQRVEQIRRMQPEIDWCLAQHLARSRDAMVNEFAPILDSIDVDRALPAMVLM